MRLAAFLAMSLVWGLTWIAAKWATDGVPPILLGGVRLLAAAPLFLLWAGAARLPLAVPSVGRLLAAATLVNTGCYGFLFWGIARSPTGIAAIVNLSLIPVLSMLIGSLVGEERITLRRVAALVLGIAGLVLLFSARGGPAAGGEMAALGLAAVVLGTASYAWGAIVSKPLVRAMPPIAVAFWQTLVGGVSMVALSLVVEGADPANFAGFSRAKPLAGAAFLVFGGSLVGFSAYLWLLREFGAFRAGLYAFVSPAIAVAVGILALGEPFGRWEGLGMAIMFCATALVVKPERDAVTAS